MKHLFPQFPPILAFYCFCMLQIPSSGLSQSLANPPDGLDIVQLEHLTYCLNQWEALSNQTKFLFHYSRTQKPTYPVNTGFPPVHPLMRLAAKLASRRTKGFLSQVCDLAAATVDFTKKDSTAILGWPFFLYRPRNGR
uniref:Neuromedin S n=1 Tax=Nannospalax galili TaxID=1026970 RepID=A0A8C6QX40_NANGA